MDVLQNLTTADSIINLSNAGFYTGPGELFPGHGYLCANIYVFGGIAPDDPQGEQLAACCSCPISRNGVTSIRGRALTGNTLTNVTLTAAAIKIVWTTPPGGESATNCNPAGLPGANTRSELAPGPNPAAGTLVNPGGFATGGRAWATHWHTVPSPFGTETKFTNVPLSAQERTVLNQNCAFIIGNGSGKGRCAGCPLTGGGAQGADPSLR